jgi:hypothetical protein
MIGPSNIHFKEQQQMREVWLWLIVAGAALVSIGGLIAAGLSKQETEMDVTIGFAILIPVQVLVLGSFYISRLEIVVNEEGVHYKWYPFQRKFRIIRRTDISNFYVRNGPIFKRGISLVPGYGWAYSASGGKGIQFELKSSRKVFLGSQRVSAFRSAVESLMQLKN